MPRECTGRTYRAALAFFRRHPDAEPTKAQMCELFHAAPATIENLVWQLKDEGFLERVIRYRPVKASPPPGGA